MAYIQQGFTPIAEHGSALVTMRLRSHSALEALVTGKANRANIDVLIAAVNMTEALYRMGVGREYSSEVVLGWRRYVRLVGGPWSLVGLY
jgi:hypothetical protein